MQSESRSPANGGVPYGSLDKITPNPHNKSVTANPDSATLPVGTVVWPPKDKPKKKNLDAWTGVSNTNTATEPNTDPKPTKSRKSWMKKGHNYDVFTGGSIFDDINK